MPVWTSSSDTIPSSVRCDRRRPVSSPRRTKCRVSCALPDNIKLRGRCCHRQSAPDDSGPEAPDAIGCAPRGPVATILHGGASPAPNPVRAIRRTIICAESPHRNIPSVGRGGPAPRDALAAGTPRAAGQGGPPPQRWGGGGGRRRPVWAGLPCRPSRVTKQWLCE